MDRLQARETKPSLSDFTQAEVSCHVWILKNNEFNKGSLSVCLEIMEMEILFEEVGEESLSKDFCQDLATSFNCSSSRTGKPAILWEQVQSWFHSKQKESPAKVSFLSIAPAKSIVDATILSNAPESSQKPEGDPKGLSELAFEAKSSKDDAWYDVASFHTYRFLSTGELEVRVKFAGFGKEEDEWVNVKKAVRDRSIPLEPSECQNVKVGDLVLCFQERSDQAIYCDAHIVEIQRRLHDIRGCRCIFVVRYDHDHTEEKVQLKRICCRPK